MRPSARVAHDATTSGLEAYQSPTTLKRVLVTKDRHSRLSQVYSFVLLEKTIFTAFLGSSAPPDHLYSPRYHQHWNTPLAPLHPSLEI